MGQSSLICHLYLCKNVRTGSRLYYVNMYQKICKIAVEHLSIISLRGHGNRHKVHQFHTMRIGKIEYWEKSKQVSKRLHSSTSIPVFPCQKIQLLLKLGTYVKRVNYLYRQL